MTARRRLAGRRPHEVLTFKHGGHHYVAGLGRFPDGTLAEVFLDVGKAGSEVALHAQDSAVLVSLCLQLGAAPSEIAHSLAGPIATALAKAEVTQQVQTVEPAGRIVNKPAAARPIIVLHLRAEPRVDQTRALRMALKLLLRRCGLRCIDVRQEVKS